MLFPFRPCLALLGLLAGCSESAERRVTVQVTVPGVPGDVILLQVSTTLADRPGVPPIQSVTQLPFNFLVSLPAERLGTLVLHVDGLDQGGCIVAQGDAQTEIGTTGPFQLRIPLDRVPSCAFSYNPPGALHGVWGSGPSDVWAAGDSGIGHWDGTAWTPVSATAQQSFLGIWGSGPRDVWAVGYQPTSVHWDGTAWTSFTAVAPDYQFLRAVWGSGPDDVWAVGFDGTAKGLIAHWHGTAWAPIYTSPARQQVFSAVWGSGPADVWAVGEATVAAVTQGLAVHWNGTAWATVPLPVLANGGLSGLWGSAPDDVWAVGAGYPASVLHWSGAAWAVVSSGTAESLNGLWGSGPTDVWAVGSGGTVGHWNGTTWAAVSSVAKFALNGVWGSGLGDPWGVGNGIVRFRR